jgi:hypothetical protein
MLGIEMAVGMSFEAARKFVPGVYWTSSPKGDWPGAKKVFINSPSLLA